jgi:hypothetical protein
MDRLLDPARGHGIKAQKRAEAARKTLLRFTDETGRIPEEKLQCASKAASLATGRAWCPARCRTLASLLGVAPLPARAMN